jgi:hypothetical protein
MRHITLSACAAALTFVACGSALADDENPFAPLQRPDPKTVTLPNLNASPTPGETPHFNKTFYFYKPGVSFEDAFADLDQCRIYAASAQMNTLPRKFVPLGGPDLNENTPVTRTTIMVTVPRLAGVSAAGAAAGAAAGSVIGMGIVYAMVEEAKLDLSNATNRRCMAYKGYQRFGTWRSISRKIEDGTETDRIARLALIASGAQPHGKAMEP